jgi:diaminopimelate epimerase
VEDTAVSPYARLRGVPFTKMTGSGNDFVVFDGRDVPRELVMQPEVIRAICDRHNGIGADGLVVLEPRAQAGGESVPTGAGDAAILLRYFNRDGTLGELCGNATLCSTALSVERGLAPRHAVRLETDAGTVRARVVEAEPEIDIAPVHDVRPDHSDATTRAMGAQQAGYARVGVPHVVLVVADEATLQQVDVVGQGRPLRQPSSRQPDGANVNWVAPLGDGRWAYRTYERGVEDETLACGTGAIAAAILLTTWGLAHGPVTLMTRSGRPVTVTLGRSDPAAPGRAEWYPSLRGEGRVVFRGTIESLPLPG